MNKNIEIKVWDYIYPFLGILIWFLLVTFGVGKIVSTSNLLVETFAIFIASLLMPWLSYSLRMTDQKFLTIISNIFKIIPLILAILLRLWMKTMPL